MTIYKIGFSDKGHTLGGLDDLGVLGFGVRRGRSQRNVLEQRGRSWCSGVKHSASYGSTSTAWVSSMENSVCPCRVLVGVVGFGRRASVDLGDSMVFGFGPWRADGSVFGV